MVAEALLLLWISWSNFGLASNNNALYTFSFLTLLYMSVFSIVSVRERRWFWATMPSKTLIAALTANLMIGTALTLAGIPGLESLPWEQTLIIFIYTIITCLFMNNVVKVMMIKWCVRAVKDELPSPNNPLGNL